MLRMSALLAALMLAGCFANPTPHPGTEDASLSTGADASADSGTTPPPDSTADASAPSDGAGFPDVPNVQDAFTGADTAPMGDASSVDASFDAAADAAVDAMPDMGPDGAGDATESDADAVSDADGAVDIDAEADGGLDADAATDADATVEPDAVVDADAAADAEPDAEEDAAADTASDSGDASGACDSTFDIPVIFSCNGSYEVFSYWSDWADESCPTWYTPTNGDTVVYNTVEELVAAEGCDGNCLYNATIVVDFISCDGPKQGYEVYEAATKSCTQPLYSTADGVFEDLCNWSAYSCYCTP